MTSEYEIITNTQPFAEDLGVEDDKPKALLVESIQWIDVDDELPDADITVLVACGVESLKCLDVFEAYRDSEKNGWSTPDGCMADHVRYWAEMPEGPKPS